MPTQDAVTRVLRPGENGELQEVRFFSDASLQASVTRALASVNERSAVLNLERNDSGFNAAVAAKLNGHWSVAVAYSRDDWGRDAAATTVKFSW